MPTDHHHFRVWEICENAFRKLLVFEMKSILLKEWFSWMRHQELLNSRDTINMLANSVNRAVQIDLFKRLLHCLVYVAITEHYFWFGNSENVLHFIWKFKLIREFFEEIIRYLLEQNVGSRGLKGIPARRAPRARGPVFGVFEAQMPMISLCWSPSFWRFKAIRIARFCSSE